MWVKSETFSARNPAGCSISITEWYPTQGRVLFPPEAESWPKFSLTSYSYNTDTWNNEIKCTNSLRTVCSRCWSIQDIPCRHGTATFVDPAIKCILSQITSSQYYIYFASVVSFLCLNNESVQFRFYGAMYAPRLTLTLHWIFSYSPVNARLPELWRWWVGVAYVGDWCGTGFWHLSKQWCSLLRLYVVLIHLSDK
jgi:hypothetical protein